jgi:hypothetical protein
MNNLSEEGVESYIVRIYRKPDAPFGDMVGLVEKVGATDKKAFRNKEELWNLLQNKPNRRSRNIKAVDLLL